MGMPRGRQQVDVEMNLSVFIHGSRWMCGIWKKCLCFLALRAALYSVTDRCVMFSVNHVRLSVRAWTLGFVSLFNFNEYDRAQINHSSTKLISLERQFYVH